MRRRFEKRVYIALPEATARASMFKLNLGDTPNSISEEEVPLYIYWYNVHPSIRLIPVVDVYISFENQILSFLPIYQRLILCISGTVCSARSIVQWIQWQWRGSGGERSSDGAASEVSDRQAVCRRHRQLVDTITNILLLLLLNFTNNLPNYFFIFTWI